MATDFTNFTAEVDVSVGEVGNAGLVFRTSKPDIGADTYCGYYAGINPAAGQVEIGCVSNSWHSLAAVPLKLSPNTAYHLKVQAFGRHLQVYVTDTNQPVVDIYDGNFTSGTIGVRNYCTDGDRSISSFRHLTVKELSN